MRTRSVYLLGLLFGSCIGGFSSISATAMAKDIGECGGCVARIVVYDQKALFMPKEDGGYVCFELQERIELANREVEKRKLELRDRSRSLQGQDINNADPEEVARLLKEQSALEIDAKLLQQDFQRRINQLQSEFLKEVQAVIQELASEFDWELVLGVDLDVVYAIAKVDVTKQIITRLNDKHRAKQRAKQFNASAKKEAKEAAPKKGSFKA